MQQRANELELLSESKQRERHGSSGSSSGSTLFACDFLGSSPADLETAALLRLDRQVSQYRAMLSAEPWPKVACSTTHFAARSPQFFPPRPPALALGSSARSSYAKPWSRSKRARNSFRTGFQGSVGEGSESSSIGSGAGSASPRVTEPVPVPVLERLPKPVPEHALEHVDQGKFWSGFWIRFSSGSLSGAEPSRNGRCPDR